MSPKTVEAYGAVLAVGQQVAGYRAPYVGPLFQETAATPAQMDTAAKAVQASDAAFAKARTVVGALNDGAVIVQGLNQAAAKLADVRTASDRVLCGDRRPGRRVRSGAGFDARRARGRRCGLRAAHPELRRAAAHGTR